MKKLPNLAAVRAFEAAARHENFTRAAEELGMSQVAVSQHVRVLEAQLGHQLFVRRARDVVLTPVGRRLGAQVADAVHLLREAFEDLERDGRQRLSVSVLPSLAATWLAPRAASFQSTHPGLSLRIDATHDQDLVTMGHDAGLWVGAGCWPGLVSRELFPIAFTPMCSPDFEHEHGPFRTVDDILQAPLIARRHRWWKMWLAAAGRSETEVPDGPDLSFDAQNLEGVAAIRGKGICLLTPALFKAEIEGGLLVRLSGVVARDGRSYWLVQREDRRPSKKIQAFGAWVMREARSCLDDLSTGSDVADSVPHRN